MTSISQSIVEKRVKNNLQSQMVNAISTKLEQQQEESFFPEKFEGCKKHALLDKLRDCVE